MIGRFDRYMLTQLMTLFGFFALVLVLVYWINRAVLLFDKLIANGQSASVVIQFSLLALPNAIRLVLPVAAFAATLFVTNRLSSESELVIVQATGFSPWRLARPVAMFGVIVAILLSILTHFLVPASNRLLAIRTTEVSQNLTGRLLAEGKFLHPSSGVTFYIRDITPEGVLENVFMSDRRDPAQTRTYTARQALLIRGDVAPKLIMIDGMIQALDTRTEKLSVTRFDNFAFDLTGLIQARQPGRRRPDSVSTPTLIEAPAATLADTGSTRATFLAIANDRFGETLGAIAAPLLGFAIMLLGGFSRFGLWRQIIGAIFALILVQIVTRIGQDMLYAHPSHWASAYLGAVAAFAAAVALLFLAANPGRLRFGRRRGTADGAGA